jgi:hypothetical protein
MYTPTQNKLNYPTEYKKPQGEVTKRNKTNKAHHKKQDEHKDLKEETDSKCRLCEQHEETTDHLTSGYPILAKNKYLMKHDAVGAHSHYSTCKALGIERIEKWYTHTPKPVSEHESIMKSRGTHRYRSYDK